MSEKKDIFWRLLSRLQAEDKVKLVEHFEAWWKHNQLLLFALCFQVHMEQQALPARIQFSLKQFYLRQFGSQVFQGDASIPQNFFPFLAEFSAKQWLETFGVDLDELKSQVLEDFMEQIADFVEGEAWNPVFKMRIHDLMGRLFLTPTHPSDITDDLGFDMHAEEEEEEEDSNMSGEDSEEESSSRSSYISRQTHYVPPGSAQAFLRLST